MDEEIVKYHDQLISKITLYEIDADLNTSTLLDLERTYQLAKDEIEKGNPNASIVYTANDLRQRVGVPICIALFSESETGWIWRQAQNALIHQGLVAGEVKVHKPIYFPQLDLFYVFTTSFSQKIEDFSKIRVLDKRARDRRNI